MGKTIKKSAILTSLVGITSCFKVQNGRTIPIQNIAKNYLTNNHRNVVYTLSSIPLHLVANTRKTILNHYIEWYKKSGMLCRYKYTLK